MKYFNYYAIKIATLQKKMHDLMNMITIFLCFNCANKNL